MRFVRRTADPDGDTDPARSTPNWPHPELTSSTTTLTWCNCWIVTVLLLHPSGRTANASHRERAAPRTGRPAPHRERAAPHRTANGPHREPAAPRTGRPVQGHGRHPASRSQACRLVPCQSAHGLKRSRLVAPAQPTAPHRHAATRPPARHAATKPAARRTTSCRSTTQSPTAGPHRLSAAHPAQIAMSTKRDRCSCAATVIVSVGPFRCLATMKSASPARGDSLS
jgi:hypothetical protein